MLKHPAHTWLRVTGIAVLVGVAIAFMLCCLEYFAVTRFESRYVAAADLKASRPFLLAYERERGTLVQLEGRGVMAAPPGMSARAVTELMRSRFPTDFDAKKVTWILRDDEGAFFYRVVPRWSALLFVTLLSAVVAAAYLLVRAQGRYLKAGRLADILALLQVLSLDDYSVRTNEGLTGALQGPPRSSPTWQAIALAHPEFFRVDPSKTNPISLLIRFISGDTSATRKPLETETLNGLMGTAILLHEREAALLQRWHMWAPVLAATVAGLFAIAASAK